jgi:hypothetical protein
MGMSETVSEGTGATGEVTDPAAGSAGHPEDQEAEEQLHGVMQEHDPDELLKQIEHWRTTAQKHERTARDNSAAAKKWRETEEASKSELQKAKEAAQAAEERANAVTAQNDRMLSAAAHNLSPDFIDFIGGGSTDEISERAERLAGLIKAEVDKQVKAALSQEPQNGGRRSRSGRPAESLQNMRAGSAPQATGIMTSDQMFRQLISGDQD